MRSSPTKGVAGTVKSASAAAPPKLASVVHLHNDGVALVRRILSGDRAANIDLFNLYAARVRKTATRILGQDTEVDDLVQEVLVTAIRSLNKLENPRALEAWLTQITVHKAKTLLRDRGRRRWFVKTVPQSELPEREDETLASPEANEALRATYRLLERLPTDDRIVFALRVIDGKPLKHVAGACAVSLATVKRRLARAQKRFFVLARQEPALAPWIDEGGRWQP